MKIMGLYHCLFKHSIHEFKIKLGTNIRLVYTVDCYQRWFVHICFVFEGIIVHDYIIRIGGASDFWIWSHFEDDH